MPLPVQTTQLAVRRGTSGHVELQPTFIPGPFPSLGAMGAMPPPSQEERAKERREQGLSYHATDHRDPFT